MENYVLKNIHVFSKEQACFLFDSDLLNVYEIDRETKEAIEMFQQQKGELPLEIYNDLLENGILISENDYCREREENINLINKLASQENSFNKIVLGVSNLCNMNCQYCYGSGGDYGLERELMSRGIAKRSIDYLLDNSGDYSTLHICFFGGEPLCNFDIVKYVVDYCKSISTVKKFQFSITTNGTLITEDIISFFKENNFTVLLSLDGPKEVHDLYRKLNDGTPSYDLVFQSLKELKRNNIHVSTRATLCSNYIYIDRIHKHAYTLGAVNSYVSLVSLDKNNTLHITNDNKAAILRRYEDMANNLFVHINNGEYDIKSPLIAFLAKLYYKNRKTIPCGAGTRIRAINYQGNVYPCQRYMGDSKNVLDNIVTHEKESNISPFQHYNVLSHPVCSQCWIKYMCGGGCHHSNMLESNNIYSCSEESCELLKGIYEMCIYMYWRLKKYSPERLDLFFGNIKNK